MTDQEKQIKDQQVLSRMLMSVSTKLASYDKFMEMNAPQLAPDFNMISCFYPDENRLSSVIAMLLDPKGEHGQGSVFLHLFLETIKAEIPPSSKGSEKLELLYQRSKDGRTTRSLEVATHSIDNSQRRIDILLDVGGVGLAIENKPWACDQEAQIKEYSMHLSNIYRDSYFLIYLSGNGCPPGEESIEPSDRETLELSGNFIVLSYVALKSWIARCSEKCRSIRVRLFLEDFIIYVLEEFEGRLPMYEENIVINSAIESRDAIRAAVAISNSWPQISKKLCENLVEQVLNNIDPSHGLWTKDIDFNIWGKWTGFSFWKSDWKAYKLRFEFEYSGANGLFWGIRKFESENSDGFPDELVQKINAELGDGLKSSWWPWYKKINQPYKDWGNNQDVWSQILSHGDTVTVITEKLQLLIKLCEEDADIKTQMNTQTT